MVKWLGQSEKCDICGAGLCRFTNKQWFVDGKTKMGPWALMCAKCFETFGVGLGVGRGQKYDANTLEKVEG